MAHIEVKVSRSAYEARVRRALRKEGLHLRIPRSDRDRFTYGPYYITDEQNHLVVSACTLDSFESEMQLLKPGEHLDGEVD